MKIPYETNTVTNMPLGNNAVATRGRPFQTGNAGRPKGARNKASLATEALLDGEAETLARKAVEMALAGDTTAMRLCLERIMPVRRDRPVSFAMPQISSASDAAQAASAIVAAVSTGELTPLEALDLSRILENFTRVLEASEFDERLRKLEGLTSR